MRCFALVAGLAFGFGLMSSTMSFAGISVAPYYSIRSTKDIKPGAKNKTTQDEVTKQREEKGLKVGVSFFRLLKFEVSGGQSVLTTTEKVSLAKDTYDQIDYEKDLDMDTSNPDSDFKTTDTQNRAKASLIIDPSFGIFTLMAKAGVVATQRSMKAEQQGHDPITKTEPITYKPLLGAGAGVKIGRLGFFMAEYNFELYKFPETQPFEREVSVSFGVNL